MTIEIKVPDIGDFDGVEIIEVLVKAGDTVSAEQSIITVESDKASMEIPCPQAGVVKELKVKIGDKVKEGTLMLILEPAEGGAAAAPKSEAAPKAEEPKSEAAKTEAPTPAAPAAAPAPFASAAPAPAAPVSAEPHNPTAAPVNAPHASPSVRKFAR